MKARFSISFALLALLLVGPAQATIRQIGASEITTSFSPDSVRIEVGDTVRWFIIDGAMHSTTSGLGSADPQSGVLWDAPLDLAHLTFQRQFTSPGRFPYYCIPHEFDGMKGVIVVTRPKTVTVTANDDQLGRYFLKDSVKIFEGDSVHWHRVTGIHTTTSGTGSADPQAGVLWRADLDGTTPDFKHKFPAIGVFPYFCEPHEFDGMHGKVVVVSQPACLCDCHGDPHCDSVTDVLDVVQGIGVAFRGGAALVDPAGFCPFQETDVDCNGVTDVLDVVKIISVAFRGGDPATVYCHACP
ncbi:MAG: hypothetical protein HY304_09400 [candidate division Zixibacteria bacterium]|nr:hypothetical protein [candidate division Zixibacteria bacterium]